MNKHSDNRVDISTPISLSIGDKAIDVVAHTSVLLALNSSDHSSVTDITASLHDSVVDDVIDELLRVIDTLDDQRQTTTRTRRH